MEYLGRYSRDRLYYERAVGAGKRRLKIKLKGLVRSVEDTKIRAAKGSSVAK